MPPLEICGKEIRTRGKLIRVGFVDGEGYQYLDNPEAALAELRRSGYPVDIFTFIQKLSDTLPRYNYKMEWDNMAALPISTFDEWMSKQIDFKVRNKIRKAAKSGVVIQEVPYDDAYVRGIHAIYNESPVRQGKPFWHYGKDLETVRKMNATFMDRSIFIGAYLENTLIGFVKLVCNEDHTQAGLMQIVSMIGHQDKAPTNALIAQAVRSCADRKISYLWYANMTYGKKQTDGLADFKRHNGFQKIDVPRFFVPLTLRGRLGLRLGLHHDLNDVVPESVASIYRKFRKQWYSARPSRPGGGQRNSLSGSAAQS
jgi:hypothetical protein